MDHTDRSILALLQENGRMSMTELGKLVGLTSPAAAERVRRLEDKGVLTGYRAVVSPEAVGKAVIAYILMETEHCRRYVEFVRQVPEVAECHRIAGPYSYLTKLVTSSVRELETFIDASMEFGKPSTLVVLSSPLAQAPILPLKESVL
ncbi:Lrp/AsnC family transcriptional regulator [Paenibacillus sp. UNC499MF]|uniref:Lrp/AsnC family transcriptional regulator n=1 Tax=Paenibacillus sp. UNC499MF TaxID=1502751 RepID=UPI0008A092FD|nr:Lrp/AsnC family transcriptional regulator [Paenibacillus sp. UNC499MF]SEG55700.1 DNA-binding transcriptional regulator, Lrp family [Paenibacillus sp. UNC499MF]